MHYRDTGKMCVCGHWEGQHWEYNPDSLTGQHLGSGYTPCFQAVGPEFVNENGNVARHLCSCERFHAVQEPICEPA